MRLAYDFTVNENGLQEYLLGAHRGDNADLVVPLGLTHAFSALADLRRSRAFGVGLHPDALGLIGPHDQLVLLELKHPNHWKTASGALFQAFAYAAWFKLAVDGRGVRDVARDLSSAFDASKVDEVRLADAVTAWRSSCGARPLGDLVLMCVVITNRSWEHVVALLNPYGINLRVVTSSLIRDEEHRARAVGWFEIDHQPQKVAPDQAFDWDLDGMAFLAHHPAAQLAHLRGIRLTRSTRDLTIRISCGDTLVAVVTPMTRETVLVEVVATSDPNAWRPFLIGQDATTDMPEVKSTISAAIEGAR